MLLITSIVGYASEPALAERLHEFGHAGKVEILAIGGGDAQRRRLRGVTDRGTEVAIALDRGTQLSDGAVLWIDDVRAVVARLTEESWLRIVPRDAGGALEAGYFIGNLHWRVRFEDGAILVALEGPESHYTERLVSLEAAGKIRIAGHG